MRALEADLAAVRKVAAEWRARAEKAEDLANEANELAAKYEARVAELEWHNDQLREYAAYLGGTNPPAPPAKEAKRA